MRTDRFIFVLVTIFVLSPSASFGGGGSASTVNPNDQPFDFTKSTITVVRSSDYCGTVSQQTQVTSRTITWEGQTEVNHKTYPPAYIDVSGSENYAKDIRVANYFNSAINTDFTIANVSRTRSCSGESSGIKGNATSIHRATVRADDPKQPTGGRTTIATVTSDTQYSL
jgi:hypothetical protein